MNVTGWVLRHPVTTSMVALGVVCLGVVSAFFLPLELLPKIQLPYLYVDLESPGLGAEELEARVVRPVEAQIAEQAGVERITASVGPGRAGVLVKLPFGVQADRAAVALRGRLEQLLPALPPRTTARVWIRETSDAAGFCRIGVLGDDPRRLREIAERRVAPALGELPGVSAVDVLGGRRRRPEIRLDPATAPASQSSPGAVARALARATVERTVGTVRDGDRLFDVRVEQPLDDLDAWAALPLAVEGERVTRLGDVASVGMRDEPARGRFRIDGSALVAVQVARKNGTHLLDVSSAVRDRLDALAGTLPPGVRLEVLWDDADDLRDALVRIGWTVGLGGLLAALVVLWFLRSVGASLVLLVVVPLALLLTATLLHLGGVTLNIVSLCGLAIGVGLLVDNAIVVEENVQRTRDSLVDAGVEAAAIRGTGEMLRPIIGATLTTVVVFLPIFYLDDEMRVLFRDAGLTITASLLASLLAAVTLVPLLTVRLLRGAPARGSGRSTLPRRLRRLYLRLLAAALRERLAVLLWIALVLLAVYGYCLPRIPRQQLGVQPYRSLPVYLTLPVGVSMETTDEVFALAEQQLRDLGDVERTMTYATPGRGEIRLFLEPGRRRRAVRDALRFEVDKRLRGLPMAEVAFVPPGGEPDEALRSTAGRFFVDVRAGDTAQLRSALAAVRERLGDRDWVQAVRADFEGGLPTLVVEPDRDLLSRLGVGETDLLDALAAGEAGRFVVGELTVGDRVEPVSLVVDDGERGPPELATVLARPVPAARGGGAGPPLERLVRLYRTAAPDRLRRDDRRRAGRIEVEYDPGAVDEERRKTLGAALENLLVGDPRLAGVGLEVEDPEKPDETEEAFRRFLWTLAGIVAAIFLVLGVVFESALMPLLVLTIAPLAGAGAVLTLYVLGLPWNGLSYLGTFVLAGIIVNNSILMLDALRRLRERGHAWNRALLTAGGRRFRPIVMTAATTALGLLPLTFGSIDANPWVPFAAVIVGGITGGTLLNLFALPVLVAVGSDAQKTGVKSLLCTLAAKVQSRDLTPSPSPPTLRLRNVTMVYPGGVRALRRVDLEIPPGLFGLVGPNGAGKTTLMRIVVGLLAPTLGSVWAGERRMGRRVGDWRGRIGYLPQTVGFYEPFSAADSLHYWAIQRGMLDEAARRREVDRLLDMVGLTADGERKVKGFSGGMRKRLGIAVALLGDPDVLIVDEPTAGLDPEARIAFRSLLAQLAARKTILLSTHIVEDVARTCNQVAVLFDGRVIYDGSPAALAERARGRVFRITVGDDEMAAFQRAHPIVSRRRTLHGLDVRFLADTAPDPRAEPREPTLEEGYLLLLRGVRSSPGPGQGFDGSNPG